MPSTRRLASLLAVALVGSLAPVLLVSAPAHAAECVSERPQEGPLGLPLDSGCDDVDPPETDITGTTPDPGPAGVVATDAMRIDFEGRFAADDQDDPGTIVTECRLEGPSQAHDWRSCTSPVTYTGLDDTGGQGTPYTFSVRAVDQEDDAYTWTGSILSPATEAVPDRDATPATVSWRVDTEAPTGILFGQPTDTFSPDEPVLRDNEITLILRSNEKATTWACLLDEAAVPCATGRNHYDTLAPGRHTFSALPTDAAGNTGLPVDEGQLDAHWWVPTNLWGGPKQRKRWQFVTSPSFVSNNALRTKRRWSSLTMWQKDFRELRLVAPTGPGFGTVRVRVNKRRWSVVRLDGRRDDRAHFQVQGPGYARRSGFVQVQVISRGKPVVIDAIMAR